MIGVTRELLLKKRNLLFMRVSIIYIFRKLFLARTGSINNNEGEFVRIRL